MTTFALVGPIDPYLDHLAFVNPDVVIAVDGGYGCLVEAGMSCDMAVGDFDSLGYVPDDVPVIELPCHKDQTDTQEALDFALSEGADTVYVYGTLGGRVDHTLAFLQLLGECAANGLNAIAVDHEQAIIPLWGEGRNKAKFAGAPWGTFSLLALSNGVTGVTESGVEYELEDGLLCNAYPLGISNEFLGQPATISIKTGSALLFIPLELLKNLL